MSMRKSVIGSTLQIQTSLDLVVMLDVTLPIQEEVEGIELFVEEELKSEG